MEKTVTIHDNHVLTLDDPRKLWQVVEGRMDVFSVRAENGSPSGYREYLFTVLSGGALWGIGADSGDGRTRLVASGRRGTTLVGLSLADPSLAGELLDAMAESWVRSATEGMACSILPKTYRELAPSDSFLLAAGQEALCLEGTFWIRPREGRVVFKGQDSFDPALGDGFFPVTGRGCVRALEDSVLEIRNGSRLPAGTERLAVMDGFNSVILSMICARREQRRKQERLQADSRMARDERLIQLSMRTLASVMEQGQEDRAPLPSAEAAGNPLLSVCRLVGRAVGIEIRSPKSPSVSLEAIARASKVRIRRVILKDQWWRTDSGPLVGFLENGERPVALLPRSKIRYRLVDETGGEGEAVDARTAARLRPFAWCFYRPFPTRTVGLVDLWRFAFQSIWKSDIASIVLIGVLGGLLGLVTPLAVGMIFNTVVPQAARGDLLQLGFFLLVSAGAGFLFQVARSVALLRMEGRITVSLQAAVLDRLLSLPIPFFRRYTSGDLAVRALGINAIRRVLSGVTIDAIFSGIFSIFSLLLLFYYSGSLALRAVLLTFLSAAVSIAAGWLSNRSQQNAAETGGTLSGLVPQIIGGLAKFRVSGAEKRAYHLWARTFTLSRKWQFRRESILNMLAVWNALYPVAASIVVFALVGSSIGRTLSVGSFLAFNTAFINFSSSFLALSGGFISVLEVIPLYKRTRPILDTRPEVDEQKSDPGELRGEIEVSHVRFRYRPDAPAILDDVYLNVRPGEFVAVVGPSGSGKSTLLRVMLGFESPETGAVYYDGQDLSTLDMRAVRAQAGVVLQNGRVMSGDIFHNIIDNSTQLTVQDAWEAAELSGLAKDIRAMPMGIHTIVSEGGSTLSGGQRQRLLIARAIVAKPRIVFLDEATSALDNRTQEGVTRGMQRLNATRIVIAHRLSTVASADRIVVLAGGRIVQQGTYGELMSQGGVFSELAKRQLA